MSSPPSKTDKKKGLVDELLLARATSLRRIVVTNDRGFHSIIARWRREGRHFAGVAYYGDQHISHRKLIDDLLLVSMVYDADDMTDHVEFLPL